MLLTHNGSHSSQVVKVTRADKRFLKRKDRNGVSVSDDRVWICLFPEICCQCAPRVPVTKLWQLDTCCSVYSVVSYRELGDGAPSRTSNMGLNVYLCVRLHKNTMLQAHQHVWSQFEQESPNMVISGSGLEATPTGCSQMKTKGSGRALYRKCGEYKLFL